VRLLAAALMVLVPVVEGAEGVATATGMAASAGMATSASTDEPDDLEIDKAEPDFTIITLPTTLRLPRHKVAFRVTHRFTRSLGQGELSDLAADFFGFDSGAQVGLELRFGLFRATQLGLNRTSDRTIQFFAEREVLRQGPHPLGLALYATVEGLDNFQEQRSPGLAIVLSRKLGSKLALYAMPAFVGHTDFEDFPGDDENTFIVGLGGRLRLDDASYLVGEVVPRVSGYEFAGTHMTFGLERRVGGHGFQINFSNSIGTTLVQLARGGGPPQRTRVAQGGGDAWYIGFNISRKFY
jgi:uncharacterized beta barrel domain-containing protein DUF5777